jgi:spore maturation protein CgeB
VRVAILGLSVTSSWGNGHATNYRALLKALAAAGHDVVFLERDVPWYAANRDLPRPPWGETVLYDSLEQLRDEHAETVADAELVVVGSYVPDGVDVAEWVLARARGVTAFYDIDTPVTLAALARGECEYLTPELVPRFDLYLSFTGGPTLGRLEVELGARRAVAFHCFVDPDAYRPLDTDVRWAAGYLGTYGADRQPALERLLLEPALARPELRFVVAGPQYPADVRWPPNVERFEHLSPPEHPAFYAAQALTVSVTRADMRRAGWSPSVRLFEAAACAVPVVTDAWSGIADFFVPGREILVEDTVAALALDAGELRAIGERARRRVLAEHTAAHRVEALEQLVAATGVAVR